MFKSMWVYISHIIEMSLFTYYIVPIGCIIWLFMAPDIPYLTDYQAAKDICGLIASIMANLLGLFFAIVVIAVGLKDVISLRMIYYEGLLQIGSLLFLSLFVSSSVFIYIMLTKLVNGLVVIFTIGLFLFTLFRLLDLIRTTIYSVIKNLRQTVN